MGKPCVECGKPNNWISIRDTCPECVEIMMAEHDSIKQQLAESRAREAQLRAALEGIRDDCRTSLMPDALGGDAEGWLRRKAERCASRADAALTSPASAVDAVRMAGEALVGCQRVIRRLLEIIVERGVLNEEGGRHLGYSPDALLGAIAALRAELPGLVPGEDKSDAKDQ